MNADDQLRSKQTGIIVVETSLVPRPCNIAWHGNEAKWTVIAALAPAADAATGVREQAQGVREGRAGSLWSMPSLCR